MGGMADRDENPLMFPRCPEPCGKARIDSEYLATLIAIKSTMLHGRRFVPYDAKQCGCWHVNGHKGGGAKQPTGKTAQKIGRFVTTA